MECLAEWGDGVDWLFVVEAKDGIDASGELGTDYTGERERETETETDRDRQQEIKRGNKMINKNTVQLA